MKKTDKGTAREWIAERIPAPTFDEEYFHNAIEVIIQYLDTFYPPKQ